MLVEVQAWESMAFDKRCEHGRPVGGNPCLQCECPVMSSPNGSHLIATWRDARGVYMWRCEHCYGVYSGPAYIRVVQDASDAAIGGRWNTKERG